MRWVVAAAIILTSAQGGGIGSDTVKNTETRFASVKTISASFKQTFYDATLGSVETSSGKVSLKKPNKMRWEYDLPYQQSIVSDGKKLYFHFPSEGQVMVEDVGRITDSRSPLLFLCGGYRLEELFNIKLDDEENRDKISADRARLELVPKERSITSEKIVLTVDTENWNIRSFSIFDWSGNRTDVEFNDMVINAEIGDGIFDFTPPKGADVFEMPGAGTGD